MSEQMSTSEAPRVRRVRKSPDAEGSTLPPLPSEIAAKPKLTMPKAPKVDVCNDAEMLKAEAEKAKAAQAVVVAKEAEAKAKQLDGWMERTAKEISVRLEKADKLDDQADDHRLAAAMKLAEAKGVCRDNKMNFQSWVTTNLKGSYETLRKLARVGEADDPAQALADMRGKNKEANKALRDRKAAAIEAPQMESEAEREATIGDNSIDADLSDGFDPVGDMLIAFARMLPSDKLAFLRQAAASIGALVELPV